MPTQEERLTTLEQTVAFLRRRSSTEVQDLNRNVTMLLGIASGQELDIKEIKITVTTMDERLERLEGTSEAHTALLNEHTTRLDRVETTLSDHTTRLDRIEAMLSQILERLPAK